MQTGVRRRWLPWSAVAMVVLVVGVGAWAVAGHGTGATASSPRTPTSSVSPAPSAAPGPSADSAPGPVALPECADAAATTTMLLSTTADGPARDAVTGTAVSAAFSLEGGAFTAGPPPEGYAPAVTAAQAGCQLSAAMGVRGFAAGPGRLALATVSIAASVGFQSSVESGVTFTSAYPGSMPAYQSRVAWILISAATNDVSSCPDMTASAPSRQPTTAASKAPADPYEIFGIDAATGGGAFMFEDSFSLCGSTPNPPLVSVPYQIVSVPWSIVSRASDGQTAQLGAAWASCEVYTGTGSTYVTNAKPDGPPPTPAVVTSSTPLQAWVQRPGHEVSITVTRPFGAECGPAQPHTLTLHPETVTSVIPADVAHAPLGLVAQQ